MKVFVMNILVLFLFQFGTFAESPGTLLEIKKPSQLLVIKNQLFISEGASVYRYRLLKEKPPSHDGIKFVFVKKFGREGEGPQEFKLNPFRPNVHMFLDDSGREKNLVINSVGRLSVFNLEGEFIREKKVNPFSIYSPIEERYVGSAASLDKDRGKLSINLYNADFKPEKEIYSTDQTIGSDLQANLVLDKINLPYESFVYQVEGNKIYFPHEEEDSLIIKSFDSSGMEEESIEIRYEREKITDTYKQEMLEWFKNRSPFKRFWEKIKKNIQFKSHFPIVKNMMVDNGCIYVFTYRKNEDGNECIVLERNNDRYDEKNISLKYNEQEPFAPFCFTIEDNYFYALHEDEETESWEIKPEPLDEKIKNASIKSEVFITFHSSSPSKPAVMGATANPMAGYYQVKDNPEKK